MMQNVGFVFLKQILHYFNKIFWVEKKKSHERGMSLGSDVECEYYQILMQKGTGNRNGFDSLRGNATPLNAMYNFCLLC